MIIDRINWNKGVKVDTCTDLSTYKPEYYYNNHKIA